MRRIIIGVLLVALAAFLVSRIPSHNPNLSAYRLVVGLIGHLTVHSVEQGLVQYFHWGQALVHRYHL